MTKNSPLARAISLAIAGSSLAVAGAQAQTQNAGPGKEVLEEVVSTGTRIRQDVYSSSAPMDVITTDIAAVRGVSDLASLLQSSTVAAGSPQVTAATSSAFVQAGGIGTQTLSLRGLGANRTLVLLNNRRAGPAGVRGEVSAFDFNVLPLAAIERIEILKDGASSIYGSDAVAGVVNVITKRGGGGTIDGYVSQPAENGGEESRINLSWGLSGDRGRFRVTGDYYRQSELAKGDRGYFRCGEQYIFDPDTGERADVVDPRTGRPACRDLLWGHVWIYDYQDEGGNVPPRAIAQYDYDGDLANYIPGFAVDPDNPDFMVTPPGWFPVNYDRTSDGIANADHPFQDAASLIPKVERTTFFGEGELDLTDTMTTYAEVLLNRRKTTVNDYRQFWSYIYNEDFFAGNPLSAGWTGAQWLSPTPITDHSDDEVQVDYRRFVLGLKGELGANWSWDVYVQYSKSDGDYTSDQLFDDSIRDQNFLAGSCEGMLTSVRGVPCVDIPWLDPQFLAGNVSPEVREFLFGRETGNTTYTQRTIEGFLSGSLFDLPAGRLGVAFGAQYTEDEIKDVPGEITLAGNAWGTSTAGITQGDDATKAVFAEVQVPLLAGKPAFERLSLNASARYTDVDSYGSDTTYKVGANWEITPTVRLRANRGTSFRAPALFELYLADQTAFLRQSAIDPCNLWGAALDAGDIPQRVADNCAAHGLAPDFQAAPISATIIAGGGYGILEAETSTSTTVGLVWQPRFADLAISLDYFDIEVKDEVDQLGARAIVFGCYESDFFPGDPLCDLFQRDPLLNNGIATVRDSFINIATQQNRGYDLSVLYRLPLAGGTLTLETQHTYQTTDKKALFADTAIDHNGEIGEPKWVGRLNATYDTGPWSFFWGVDMIGKGSNYESFGGNTATYRGATVRVVLDTERVFYHSFSVTRELAAGFTARVGVANAFDEEPPRLTTLGLGEVDTVGNSAFYSQYDWLGRRFFLNVTKTF